MTADDNRNLRLGYGNPEVPVVGDTAATSPTRVWSPRMLLYLAAAPERELQRAAD